MGFDNECILNIQSLPGEYFCPVCRTLVYPNEALQTQCTHLYCKPCLAYIVATTCACPYDGYLVSEAEAKPLIESNKPTAEAIEKIQVHCLYHRSGCQWQGTLSECITHCTSCNFGNSPVVCNRCGTQIIHRQVQEHAQICPGVQPQAQQGSTQNQGNATQNQIAQPAVAASQEPTSQLAATSTPVAPTAAAPVPAAASAPTVAAAISASGQAQSNSAVQPQSVAQVPSTEQWYQQQQLQYQQYYQQYSGYDPYQQYYQQYGYYQQQAPAQYPQAYAQPHPIQGQQQPQAYIQQQPQAQPQANLQPQPQVQTSSFPQPLSSGQIPQPQAPANIQQPVQAHLQQPQMHPPTQSQVPGQPLGQLQTQNTQLQPQTLPQAQPPHLQPQIRPQHQQPMAQHPPPQLQQQPPSHAQYQPQINSQPHTQLVQQPPIQVQPQQHPRPYSVPHSHQLQMQPQPQPQPQTLPQAQLQPPPQSQPQAQPQLHTAPAHAVTGHQSFPQTQFHQQTIPGAPTHQRPMHMHPPQQASLRPQIQQPSQMHNQFPQQQPTQAQMRPPPPPQMPLQGQQQAAMPSVQGAHAHLPPGPQQAHHLVHPSAQQVHHPPGMQAPLHPSIPQQQAQGSQHQNQLHQQGPFPPQQPSHPQQVLRPHGLPFSHQPSQLPSATQTAPRPMVPAHTLQQQPFAQSVGGPGVPPQVSSDHKVGSVQFMHSESQSTTLSSTPSMNLKAIIDENRGDYLSEKTGPASGEVLGKSGGSSVDLQKQVSENSLKHEGDKEKLAEKAEGKNSHPVVNGESSAPHVDKDLSEDNMVSKVESSGVPEKSPHRVSADSFDEHRDEQNITAVEAKGVDRMSNEADDRPIHGQIQKEDSTKAQVHQDAVRTMKPPAAAEKPDQNHVTQNSMYGNERGSVQSVPRHPPHPSAPPTYDLSAVTTNDRNFQPGYPDRNVPQFPPPGAAPSDARPFPPPMQVQSMGPPVHHTQMQDHERFIQQVPPHAPPYMQDTMSHRPPAPERTFMQQMPYPGPNQERMFQEPQPPHSVPTHGQPLAPNQMRPPHNVPETLTHQVRPAFPDPLQGLNAPGSFPVQGPHAPLGRGPGSFGPQGPQLSGQGQMMPPPTVGSRISPVEPFPGPPMMGPPSGSLATAVARNARGPPIHLEGQMPQLHPLSAEPFPGKMPGLYDGRQQDYPRSMTMEHFPQGMQPNNQPNVMSMNALPGKGPDSSQFQGLGERFKPLPEERFKSLGEEGFKTPLEDHFRPYGRAVDRRDFEEDLKQFPRPSDLDSEGGFKFENYLSSSRPPIDRNVNIMGLDGPSRPFDRGFGPEAGPKIGTSPIPSRFIPMGHSGSHLGGSSLHPMDSIERSRSHGLNDDNLGRKGDAAHPDFRKVASDFGHRHLDSLHPLRSPGRELGGLPSSRFGSFSMGHGLGGHSRLEEFGGREPNAFGERSKQHNLPPDSIVFHESRFPALPGSGFRRGEPDPIGNIPGHMRSGNLDGHETLPGHMRGDDPLASGPGSFRNNFRFGDFSGLDNVPPHMRAKDFMRFGEPGFGSGFSKHGFPNEPNALGSGPFQGSLDQMDHRKRKVVSISWCRICKIDCETVEGLDLHSQTKEHQKMAMDIVLSIKQDNAKKQKLSSEEHDEANKARKTGFEGRPVRR